MTENDPSPRNDPVDDLVKSARTDREAFGELFEHFYPLIFAYCARRFVVRSVAEDVTSEVFLRVVTGLSQFSGTTAEDFSRWLFRIATNEINAQLRKSIRRRELLEAAARMGTIGSDIAVPLLETESPVEWQDVYRNLSELSDQEQSIISLRFFAGFPHQHIAEILEIKTGTVRVALNRALQKLRDRLRSREIPSRTTPGTTRGGH